VLAHARPVQQLEVWQRLGLPIEECLRIVDQPEAMNLFRSRIFSRIVPTARDIGLWGQHVQEAFAAMGAIEFAGVDAAALLGNDALPTSSTPACDCATP
jgi:hypothetical protein